MPLTGMTLFASLAAVTLAASEAAHPTSANLLPRSLELASKPKRVAVIQQDDEIEILLLGDHELALHQLKGTQLVNLDRFQFRVSGARALCLDSEGDGQGRAIVAATFAEDVLSVDRGTSSRIHGLLFTAGKGALAQASTDLSGYVRLLGGRAYLQPGGQQDPFDGPVTALVLSSGRYSSNREPVPWANRWLLDATPWPDGDQAIAWERDRPIVVDMHRGTRVPGGSLPDGLGGIQDPFVAGRLDAPLVRGLSKEGRNTGPRYPIPRRVIVESGGVVYTLSRGRSGGIPIFGQASGEDSVVRLVWKEGQLTIARPYPGVGTYILDFALIRRGAEAPLTVLLTNDSPDGSGMAHLVIQRPRAPVGSEVP